MPSDAAPTSSFAQALHAAAPDPEHAAALQLYGQFVGEWEFDAARPRPDGTVERAVGEWHFGWILEGRAVEDVWMVPTRAQRDAGAPLIGYGITVRVLDPSSGTWGIHWHDVMTGVTTALRARAIGDEIVQEGTAPDGTVTRWTFSRITRDRFHWRAERSQDGGRTWQAGVVFDARRRA